MNTINNIIGFITGTIISEPIEKFINNKKLYSFDVKVNRHDDVYDIVELLSEKVFNLNDNVRAVGFIYSYREFDGYKERLRVCLYSLGLVIVKPTLNKNFIIVSGKILRKPILRKTPKGTNICDILLSVNNVDIQKESSIIPCISWNLNAEKSEKLSIGDEVFITGRLQSRPYNKIINGENKTLLARELSINSIEVIKSYDE